MAKIRIHREWFMTVVKKACPCGSNSKRGAPKHQVYSWGEYHNVKWRTVDYFCEVCFQERVVKQLIAHAGDCGCVFELCARSGHGPLPEWLKMPDTACAA